MAVHIRLRHKLLGGHRHVRVFVGKSPDQTLAMAGKLVFSDDERLNEWRPFITALFSGAAAYFDDEGGQSLSVDAIEEE